MKHMKWVYRLDSNVRQFKKTLNLYCDDVMAHRDGSASFTQQNLAMYNRTVNFEQVTIL